MPLIVHDNGHDDDRTKLEQLLGRRWAKSGRCYQRRQHGGPLESEFLFALKCWPSAKGLTHNNKLIDFHSFWLHFELTPLAQA